MSETFKSGDIARFAAFTAAMSVATDRVNDFSARRAALSSVFESATRQIVNLSPSATQMIAPSHVVATYCQGTSAAATGQSSRPSSCPETAQRWIVQGATVLAAAGVLLGVKNWLLTTSVGLNVMSRLGAIRKAVTAIWRAVAASEAFAAVAETAGALIALVVDVLEALAIADIVAKAAAVTAVAGLVYPAWRNWTAIMQAIGKLGAAIRDETIKFVGMIARAMGTAIGDFGSSISENRGSTGAEGIQHPTTSRVWGLVRGVASAMPVSVVAGVGRRPGLVSSISGQAQLRKEFEPAPLTVRAAAAIAMLSAPLLAAPAMAAFPSRQRGANVACERSIVLNSTPTIVINSNQPADIEQQVLGALRQHREALFEQLRSELQRRQRTEF